MEKQSRNRTENELETIDNAFSKLSEEKANAEEQVKKIEGSIIKLIDAKKNEKERKVKTEQQKLTETITKIDFLIENEKASIGKKEAEIKTKQKKELDKKGADTKRIGEIDLRFL